MVRSSSTLPVIEKLLKGMKFDEAQSIMYDPRQIISKRKQDNRCGIFKHHEMEKLRAFSNLEIVDKDIPMMNAGYKVQDLQEVHIQLNTLAMDIQTHPKNDSVNKRSFEEIDGIEGEDQSFDKREKTIIKK